MKNLSIRASYAKDLIDIMDIDLKSFNNPFNTVTWRKYCQNGTVSILLATFNKLPIGFILWQEVDGYAGIVRLAVKPNYRKQGAGNFLLRAVEVAARAHGLREVVVIVPETNCSSDAVNNISSWLLRRGYFAKLPIVKDFCQVCGTLVDGFCFIKEIKNE